MSIDEYYEAFLEKLESYYSNVEIDEIKKAFLFASEHHKGKIRLNKTDYMTHPLGVSEILLDFNVDSKTIVSSLIHETINHGGACVEEIEEKFGSEVAHIVEVISKINRLELTDDSNYSAMNLRKILVGMSSDVRILFIKLADRLHNLRTADALDSVALKRKVNETMSVLIPIAHRLGMYQIKGEMEDLCLRYSKPSVYHDIEEKLSLTKEQLEDNLQEMQDSIQEILIEQNISFKIKSRVKSVYSIYNKLNNGKKWENIYDILALRVVVDKVSDCYLLLGLIHAKYRPIPGRFKDYIAMPKQNMYQSLHTGVFGRDGNRYEIQIRTKEMDEYAEKGFAAHFAYKEKHANIKNIMEQRLEIFRNLIESSKSLSDKDFVDDFTKEFVSDSIYVFTPKGDVLELPIGSTPIDFAYRIHSHVGDKTVGAIVNDQIVPLNYELQNNDIVNIKMSPSGTPNKEWLKIVKTTHAKNKIKSYFSKQEKENYTEKGKSILLAELRKRKLSFDHVFSNDHVNKILSELKLETLDELYFMIGTLRYTVSYILSILEDEKRDVHDVLLERITKNNSFHEAHKSDILVNGQSDIRVNLAKCCHPVFGDSIVGYITKGDGVTVHLKTCPNVQGHMSRLVDVAWTNLNEDSFYYTTLIITCLKDKNYILDLISKTSQKNVYVDSFKTKEGKENTIYELNIKTKSKNEIEDYMNSLYDYSFVLQVTR